MRLFVAADLPAGLREELAAAAPPRPWRALRPEMLHVTLAFLGERPEEDVGVIVAGVAPDVDAPVCAIGETLARDPVLPGSRADIRDRSVVVALHLLRRFLRGEEFPIP